MLVVEKIFKFFRKNTLEFENKLKSIVAVNSHKLGCHLRHEVVGSEMVRDGVSCCKVLGSIPSRHLIFFWIYHMCSVVVHSKLGRPNRAAA